MQLLSALIFAGAALASAPLVEERSMAFMALEGVIGGVLKRQDICKPVPAPATCERSCGPGFIRCVKDPYCYNPGRGDICCSNGYYCHPGFYCTDNGCCPEGKDLSECDATATVGVVPPPATEQPSDTETPATTPATKPPGGTETPATTASSNATVTAPLSPPVTVAGAGKNAPFSVLAAIGGLVALFMVL